MFKTIEFLRRIEEDSTILRLPRIKLNNNGEPIESYNRDHFYARGRKRYFHKILRRCVIMDLKLLLLLPFMIIFYLFKVILRFLINIFNYIDEKTDLGRF